MFPSIIPGVYAVQVTKAGFSICQMDDLKVKVGPQAALDIALQIGELRTVVTVSSAVTEALDTTSPAKPGAAASRDTLHEYRFRA